MSKMRLDVWLGALVSVGAVSGYTPAPVQGQVTAQVASERRAAADTMYPAAIPFLWPKARPEIEGYDRLDMCIAGAGRLAAALGRGRRDDTVAYNPDRQMPAEVVAAARKCLARWPMPTVEGATLPLMQGLAIIAGDDSLVAQITTRELAIAARKGASAQSQIKMLYDVMLRLTSASPARMKMVADVSRRVDAYAGASGGAPSQELLYAQRSFHEWLMEYGMDILDLDLVSTHAKRFMEIGLAELRVAKTPNDSVWANVHVSAGLEFLRRVASLKLPASYTARQVVESVAANEGKAGGLSADSMIAFMGGSSLLEKQAPPLRASYVFPRANTPIPEPGKISLFAYVSASCDAPCSGLYEMLRRVQRAHPMVAVTLVAHVQGQVRNLPPEPMPVEVERIRSFFLDTVKLAPRIVIDTVPHIKIPAPDRRYVAALFPTVDDYLPGLRRALMRRENALQTEGNDSLGVATGWSTTALRVGVGPLIAAVIVDAQGRVRFSDAITTRSERLLSGNLAHLLSEQSPRKSEP